MNFVHQFFCLPLQGQSLVAATTVIIKGEQSPAAHAAAITPFPQKSSPSGGDRNAARDSGDVEVQSSPRRRCRDEKQKKSARAVKGKKQSEMRKPPQAVSDDNDDDKHNSSNSVEEDELQINSARAADAAVVVSNESPDSNEQASDDDDDVKSIPPILNRELATTTRPNRQLSSLLCAQDLSIIATSSKNNKGGTATADSAGAAIITYFDDMVSHPQQQQLLRGIYCYGFETPSAIQQRAITAISARPRRDVMFQSQSGTGKTAAFAIGLLSVISSEQQHVNESNDDINSSKSSTQRRRRRRNPQALVLCPTRELALQTRDVILQLGQYMYSTGSEGLSFCAAFIGGSSVQADLRKSQSGLVDVAIGNTGRVLDLLHRGALRTDDMKILVLDEADEMLSRAFCDQVYDIFRYLPRDLQVVLAASTLPREIVDLTAKFMRDPILISTVGSSSCCASSSSPPSSPLLVSNVKHFYVAVDEEYKVETLMDLYESLTIAQCVVFINTRRKIDYVAHRMNQSKRMSAFFLHADMPRDERQRVVSSFRAGQSRMLITGSMLERGLDFHHVNIVVNFDCPLDSVSYTQRAGRCGRYGRKGIVISFVNEHANEPAFAQEMVRKLGGQLEELPLDFAKHLAT